VPEGDLRRQRVEAMKLVQHRDMSKRRLEELPWSTGLLDVWRDPELLSMSLTGGLCGVCCILYLPAKTFVDVQNGSDVWKRYIDPKLTAEEVGIKGAMGAIARAGCLRPPVPRSRGTPTSACLFALALPFLVAREVEVVLTSWRACAHRCRDQIHVARMGDGVEHDCADSSAPREVLLAVAVATQVYCQGNGSWRFFECSVVLHLFNAARGARSASVRGRNVHGHETNRRRQTTHVRRVRMD